MINLFGLDTIKDVTSNPLNCDGFEVMNGVLSDILPKLNINSAKTNTIQRPVYNSMDEDNIYTYLNMYSVFFMFEKVNTKRHPYTKYEQAVYITTDLDMNTYNWCDKGITHVRMQLYTSTNGSKVPKDVHINKIVKTIYKYSPKYKVGEYSTIANNTIPIVHAMRNNNFGKNNRMPHSSTPRCKKVYSIKCIYVLFLLNGQYANKHQYGYQLRKETQTLVNSSKLHGNNNLTTNSEQR